MRGQIRVLSPFQKSMICNDQPIHHKRRPQSASHERQLKMKLGYQCSEERLKTPFGSNQPKDHYQQSYRYSY